MYSVESMYQGFTKKSQNSTLWRQTTPLRNGHWTHVWIGTSPRGDIDGK